MSEESEFERRVQTLLRDSVDALDGRMRARLSRARHAALHQQLRPARMPWRNWAPAGAAAAAVVVTLLYVGQNGVPPAVAPSSPSSLDMLDLLADGDAYELNADTDQDLGYDFYEWAAAQDGAAEVGT